MQRYEAPRLSVLGSFQNMTLLDVVLKDGPNADVISHILQVEGSIIGVIDP